MQNESAQFVRAQGADIWLAIKSLAISLSTKLKLAYPMIVLLGVILAFVRFKFEDNELVNAPYVGFRTRLLARVQFLQHGWELVYAGHLKVRLLTS